ncbi:MAG: FAD-dependent oxidoreductase [Thermoleophilia bacterium]|nr:FAD-dependent oxidoreductase [Thermoleophilia bacterium]MDH4344726.1 FAD-dependent oxidoreductase [Thermoleophilia bacterium]
MKEIFFPKRMFRRPAELKRRYDVVIIGGGSHGLATAYYLAKNHGITNVAILEKSYIGAGAAGRNTTIIRSNYRTPEGAEFYQASVGLYERLSQDLDFNLMFSQHGHFTLAHSDRSLVVQQERAEVNKLLGIDSRVISAEEVKELCPQISISRDVTWPILGALYHAPGGIIRHDAVVWGYARKVDEAGIEIHQGVEVTGFERKGSSLTKVKTTAGDISAGVVLSATAGWSSILADMAGVPLPITTSILQAFVTEPVKPFLDKIIVSAQMHIYVSQTDRGEFLIGAEVEPYPTYSNKGTFPFVEYAARHVLELFPQLHATRILRHWTGLCDMSPDYSPIMGLTELDGFLVDCGWGTYGFKAAPITGVTLAELIATGETPALIEPFKLERFYTDTLVSELAAAAVSH